MVNISINFSELNPTRLECPVCPIPLDTYTASFLFWWLLGLAVLFHVFNLFLFDHVIQYNKYRRWVIRVSYSIAFVLSSLALNLYFYL